LQKAGYTLLISCNVQYCRTQVAWYLAVTLARNLGGDAGNKVVIARYKAFCVSKIKVVVSNTTVNIPLQNTTPFFALCNKSFRS